LSRLSIDPALCAADTSGVPAVAALAAPFDRDVDAGLARIAHHAARAREQGARLLVLPESALGGYLREPGPDEMAPDVPAGLAPDAPEIARLIALAGDMVICAGYSELGPGGLYASAICVSGDGVLGHQR
jgi:N-carbamoylputrescine amidase